MNQRRWMVPIRHVAVLCGVAAGCVAVAGCGSGSSSSSPPTAKPAASIVATRTSGSSLAGSTGNPVDPGTVNNATTGTSVSAAYVAFNGDTSILYPVVSLYVGNVAYTPGDQTIERPVLSSTQRTFTLTLQLSPVVDPLQSASQALARGSVGTISRIEIRGYNKTSQGTPQLVWGYVFSNDTLKSFTKSYATANASGAVETAVLTAGTFAQDGATVLPWTLP